MEDVDLTEESNKSFFSFEESTSSMNPCAKVRLPNVFHGILVGKAHTVRVFRGHGWRLSDGSKHPYTNTLARTKTLTQTIMYWNPQSRSGVV